MDDTSPAALRDQLYAAALDYADRGFSIIPTKLGTKIAAIPWKRYQHEPPTRRRIRAWFAREDIGGLAAILGPASGGVGCRDFDSRASYEGWVSSNPDVGSQLPTVQTPRGAHVYFGAAEEQFVTFDDGELRATSGHYCLLPPSVHPSGIVYRWSTPLVTPLPHVSPAIFLPPVFETPSGGCGTHAIKKGCGGGVWGSDFRIEDIVRRTLPTGVGQRNRRLFDLARALKWHPDCADKNAAAARPIVEQWFEQALPIIRTKKWAETWKDFVVAWDRARQPVRAATLGGLSDLVFKVVPLRAGDREERDILRLDLLCEALQQQHGDAPFFLSCRMAAMILGISKSSAQRHLKDLVEGNKLKVARKGTYGKDQASLKASEYWYVGPMIDRPETW